MSKRKLTQQQTQRIASNQQTRTENVDQHVGTLISRFGRNALIADLNWQLIPCHFRQNLPDPVPGDKVAFEYQQDKTGVITAIQPRKTTLNRLTLQGELKPIAANITQMFITISPVPKPSSELIDRYVIAAENSGFSVVILLNKCDLDIDDNLQALQILYQTLGYKVIAVSATNNLNMLALQQQLKQQTSIFVGQSGVGKSSLIKLLLPEEDIRIGDISETKGHGRHTTTTTTLYRIDQDSYLIDSPGVRQFRLWHATAAEILRGFKEIQRFSQQCQFRDCKHDQEIGCAVKSALKQAQIHPTRFRSWQKISLNP